MSDTIEPAFAVEQYLTDRSYELSDSSVQNQRYRLGEFLKWAETDGNLDDVRNLNERRIHEFKLHRQQMNLSPNTVRNHLYTFKKLLEFCASRDYVDDDLARRLSIPRVNKHDQADDEAIDPEVATEIIETLERFHYARRKHVVFHLLWHTGMRRGSLRALDVSDWCPGKTPPRLEVRHRPETDTPLKLNIDGERDVAIRDADLARAIEDYIEQNRTDVTDEHGRKPLLTTAHGRVAGSTVQSTVYELTSPCFIGVCTVDGEGPVETCEWTSRDTAYGCPASVSPHPIRRSSITWHLNQGVSKDTVAERCAVSTGTLDLHYDVRTCEERMQGRQSDLDSLGWSVNN